MKSRYDKDTHRLEAVLATAQRLRESQRRFRLIADHVADVIWSLSFDQAPDLPAITSVESALSLLNESVGKWRFDYLSPSATRSGGGYTIDEVMALRLPDLLTPQSYAAATQSIAESVVRERDSKEASFDVPTLELEFVRKDGSHGWCEVTCTFLRDGRGRLVGALGISRDISRRKETERALQEQDVKLRSLFENLPDMVIIVDRNATIQFANHGPPGSPPEMLAGANGFSFSVPQYQPACRRAFTDALATREVQTVEMLDIFGYWWACRVVPMTDDGEIRGAMIICTDITEQKKAADAVLKEQQLLRQLLELQERDRQLVAYEIHDGFAQQLTAALYSLEGYQQMPQQQSESAQAAFAAALQSLRTSIGETRRLISGLRPPILDEFGIVAALDYLICECRRPDGPAIQFLHDVEFDRLAPPLESAIFRVVQESLNNACRHSGSEKIRVELFEGAGAVRVNVRDWGIGFDPDKVQHRCFGLQGVRERARLLDGQFSLVTAAGQGTQVSVDFPLVERIGK